MKIVIGSDHCGYELKMKILPHLKEKHEVIDQGCYSTDMVDFPDIAQKVCDTILSGKAERGIMFCSTGIGAAIACNKISGIRAGVCHDIYSAHQCVEHDNVQVLAIGGDIVGQFVARQLVDVFLDAEFFTDEEFCRRVKKLEMMEVR